MATPIPLSIRLAVLLLIVSEHSIAYMIPTYLPWMMQDFIQNFGHLHTPENIDSEISYYSGILEGLHRFMSILSCFIWGYYSDRIGRQYSLIIVLTGIIISSIGLGLTQSYTLAVVFRCIAGLCGGTVPITKAMLRDVSDDTNIAVLYSYFGTGHGIAAVLGPLIAGSLAHPFKTFPSLFNYEFFYNYPYFLPQTTQ